MLRYQTMALIGPKHVLICHETTDYVYVVIHSMYIYICVCVYVYVFLIIANALYK